MKTNMSFVVAFLVTMLSFLPEGTAFTPSNTNILKRAPTFTQSMANSIQIRKISSRSSSTHCSSTNMGVEDVVWSEEQLMDYASKEGVVLSLSTVGPGYRAVARAKHNSSQILGYCEGFLRPYGGVLHLDKMEVFKKMVVKTSRENPDEFRGGGTLLGVGQLLGYLCLSHGKKNGYTIAEFLAIDDEEKQHRKLVQYYRRSGFKIIKYVGDGPGDIPDRLVWGGRGTLMREEIDTLLKSWTRVFEKTAKP